MSSVSDTVVTLGRRHVTTVVGDPTAADPVTLVETRRKTRQGVVPRPSTQEVWTVSPGPTDFSPTGNFSRWDKGTATVQASNRVKINLHRNSRSTGKIFHQSRYKPLDS